MSCCVIGFSSKASSVISNFCVSCCLQQLGTNKDNIGIFIYPFDIPNLLEDILNFEAVGWVWIQDLNLGLALKIGLNAFTYMD